jgi:hypothetical protein
VFWAEATSIIVYLKQNLIRSSIFWDITLCNPLKVKRRFGGTCRLHLQGRRISQALHQRDAGGKQRCYDTTEMEATCSSETVVDFQRTTWCYIPEDRNLHNHRSENLKSYIESYQFYQLLHTVLRSQRSNLSRRLLSFIKTKIIVSFLLNETFYTRETMVSLFI